MKSLISGLVASRARYLHLGALSKTRHFLNTSLYEITPFRSGGSTLSHLMLPLSSRASLVVLKASLRPSLLFNERGPLCLRTCLVLL